jgi:hypothetical protein
MIVLGADDADLGGAPPYWRSLDWRPPGPDREAFRRTLAAVPSIPFDRCAVVHRYDATVAERPLPDDQGWKTVGGTPVHDPDHGVLRIDAGAGEELWFRADAGAPGAELPDSAVLWALFAVEGPGRDERGEGGDERPVGIDFEVLASRAGEPSRGLRASWGSRFLWRSVGTGQRVRRIAATVPHDTLTEAWHGAAIDGRLAGLKSVTGDGPRDDVPLRDDGGMTIGSLDGLINNDPRAFFGTAGGGDDRGHFSARFGKTDREGGCRALVRRVVASAPGRWLAAEFRAAAPGRAVRLRLVLYADLPADGEGGAAAFLIRYAAGGDIRPNERAVDAVTISRQFDRASAHRIVEAAVDLRPFRAGAPLWFSVERDVGNDSDRLDATVHLLQVILEAV